MILAAAMVLQIQGLAHALILSDVEVVEASSLAAGYDTHSVFSPWSGTGSVSVRVGMRPRTFSGVLIDRRHVLTAAHVLGGATPGDVVFNLNHGGNLTHRIPAATITVHPDYAGFDPRRPNDDLAVIRLVRDVPADIPIYPIYRGVLSRGELITLVGYGGGGDGVNGAIVPPDPAVRRIGYNRADALIADDEGSGRYEVYQFDFDGPDPASNRMGGLALGGNLEASVAAGDSGSPAFVHDRGGWWLAGINTFEWKASDGRSGVFGAGGGGMLLSAYAGWIDATVLARDETPLHRGYVLAGLCAAGFGGAGLLLARRKRNSPAALPPG